jgi:hypothetical protein
MRFVEGNILRMFWTAVQAIFVFAVFLAIHCGFSYVSRKAKQSAKSIASRPAKINSQPLEQNVSRVAHPVTPIIPPLENPDLR